MPVPVPDVSRCLQEGRFEDALSQLDWKRAASTVPADPPTALLVADLLERTGRSSQAREVRDQLARCSRLTESEVAGHLVLSGIASKRLGKLEEALAAFQQACRHAERAESIDLTCWAQLRLLGTAADLGRQEIVASVLDSLSGSVEKAAAPVITTAYHLFLAEVEAKRGHLSVSRHQSQLAASLLERFPNAWLRGLLDLHESCLCYLSGDFASALRLARDALAASSRSGHQQTRVIALVDMAAAYLAVGQPARAEICISVGLSLTRPDEVMYGLLLETLAEAQLICRNAPGCKESLDRARAIASSLAQTRSSWNRTWNLRTELRLLQREGLWSESLRVIREAQDKGLSPAASFARVQVRVLEALAVMRIQSVAGASDALIGLLQEPSILSLSVQGALQAAFASLLDHADERAEPREYCARALRVLGCAGEASTLVEIADQFIATVAPEVGAPAGKIVCHPSAPLWRPREVTCNLGTSSSVSTGRTRDVADLIAFMGLLPEYRSDPRLLGEETLRLLSGFGWIRSGSLRETTSSGGEVTVVSYSTPLGTRLGLVAERTTEIVSAVTLGTKQERTYQLMVVPAESGAPALHCAELLRLISAFLAAEPRREAESPAQSDAPDPPEAIDDFGLFVSPKMKALLASVKRVAPLRVTILLTGESGTGKEVIARAVHRASGMTTAPYVPFNCAAIPRDMVDSQLFGYRRGAFTGAAQSFGGVIRAAEGGTLFLDEIGELALETQPKLLRFLDCEEIQPLGEALPRRVPVRVIAATNASMERLVKKGQFREDLYFRLNVVRFHVPPLRERRDEIRPFVARFLRHHSAEFGKHGISLSDEAIEHLLLYEWPGNVRELSHEIRRICALHEADSVVGVRDLKSEIWDYRPTIPQVPDADPHTLALRLDRRLADVLGDVERAAINLALHESQGRLDVAARRLGLSRKGLYLKRQRLGLG